VAVADAAEAARLAWHIGNRHTPVQVLAGGGLRLSDDPVVADMLEGLGATVRRCRAPFSPETGAYAGRGSAHQHGHASEHADAD
jgi:urease accessory protein